MQVYLATCVTAREQSPVMGAWRENAANDEFRIHGLTDDPAKADLILFIDLHLCPDWRLDILLRHPLVHEHRDKVLVYNDRDQPWCALPGLYPSMPATYFDARLQRACAYYSTPVQAEEANAEAEPDLLFSFVGGRSHPVRDRILDLKHARSVVEDTSGFVFYDCSDPESYHRRKASFLQTLGRSKFVLCPRGAGTSSFRLFETIAAGRVPVIVSDEWVPPSGIEWETCSVRIPEAEVGSIPARLEAIEADYPKLSCAVKNIHHAWFSKKAIFHRMMDWCAELLPSRSLPMRFRNRVQYLRFSVRHLKHRVRIHLGSWRRKTKLSS